MIPEGVETLGSHAFYWSRLLAVDFPTSLKRIGAKAFGLTAIGFDGEAIVLPDDFRQMIIPDSVTAIDNSAFANCKQMTFLKIGTGTSVLPSGAFENCDQLKRLEFGEGVVEIGPNCFRGNP